jgi:hypothetical protein
VEVLVGRRIQGDPVAAEGERRWTAGRWEMKSAMNVCQQIKRLKTGKLNLPKEAKRWQSRIDD